MPSCPLRPDSFDAEKHIISTSPQLTAATRYKIARLQDRKLSRMLATPEALKHHQIGYEIHGTQIQESISSSERFQAHAELNESAEPSRMNRGHTMSEDPATHYDQPNRKRDNILATHVRGPDRSYDLSDKQLMDFATQNGEISEKRSSPGRDDLKARLEGLRRFREWNGLIREDAWRHNKSMSDAKAKNNAILFHGSRAVYTRANEVLGTDLPLNCDSERTLTSVTAPTPFSSPQITPVPTTGVNRDRGQFSSSLPSLDLQEPLSRGPPVQVEARAQSRTLVISSGSCPSNTPTSSSIPKIRCHSDPLERNTLRSRARPPVSFPKDFYALFPQADGDVVTGHMNRSLINATDRYLTPRISPKSSPAPTQDQKAVQTPESPATACDQQGKPSFYTTIHYFTSCAHSSPPANRPLDPKAQPRPDPDFHPFDPSITRSIMPGACFDCDLAERRRNETKIIEKITRRTALLTIELAKLLDKLELDDSDEEEADCLHNKHSTIPPTYSTSRGGRYSYDLETQGTNGLLLSSGTRAPQKTDFGASLDMQIRDLEAQIEQLREEQEEQVKDVWRGFTPRWGPGTLGIQRDPGGTNIFRGMITRGDSGAPRQSRCISADEFDDMQLVKPDTDSVTENQKTAGAGESSVSTYSTSRERSDSINSRDSTSAVLSSFGSVRDVPGSRKPGLGRMRVGWIREAMT